MKVRAVVFDLDGTLTAFNINYGAVRVEVRALLAGVGIPTSLLSLNESIFAMLEKARVLMREKGKSANAFEEIRSKSLAIAEKYEVEAAKSTILLPGVEETLKVIKDMRLKVGLCTINGPKSTNCILERFGMSQYFDAVVARDKVQYVKPNTEHLEAVLQALAARPEETVVIGDGLGDMRCTTELKAIGVGLTTGLSTIDELMNSGASYVITSITDLPAVIREINRHRKL